MDKTYRSIAGSTLKDVNIEEKSIVHIISTETSDRYGDIVRVDGMDATNFSKNPVVLYGHASRAFPVGKNLWLKKIVLPNGTNGILAKTKFANIPEGETVFKLWQDGFLNAASIGFSPIEYEKILQDGEFVGYDFKKWELLEYSIVPIPANPDALRLELEQFEDNLVVKSLRESLVQYEENSTVKTQIEELTQRVNNLEQLITTIHEQSERTQKTIAEIAAERQAEKNNRLIQESIRRAISNYRSTNNKG